MNTTAGRETPAAVAPKGDEPVVISFVDKFVRGDTDTGLQKMLKDKGITTVVLVGTASHNGVLFTAVSAALRGFEVIVPMDGIAGNNSYEDQLAAYTLTSSIVYKGHSDQHRHDQVSMIGAGPADGVGARFVLPLIR